MGDSSDEARARAEAKFQSSRRPQRKVPRRQRSTRLRRLTRNTARLKSLRLTKEAADKEKLITRPSQLRLRARPGKTKSAATKKKPSP